MVMNSKQRRQDRKKWKYHVRLTYDQADRNGYDNMFDWCRDTFGNGVRNNLWREESWSEFHQEFGTSWQFTDGKTAALFALKWS